jgi:predicted CoA-binding protein
MDAAVQDFINSKHLAVAGASRKGNKFGNAAYKELKTRGYEVFLLHPEAETIDGEPCYRSLSDLNDKVEGVVVSVPPAQAEKVLHEAAEAGVRNVWLQQGAETQDLLKLGHDLDLNLVSGKCILMYAPPVRSFHSFHRFVMKLMGQL